MRNLSHLIVLLLLTSPLLALAQNANNNKINSLRSAGSMVEVELTSPDEFTVRDALIQLHLGDRTYMLSRAPANGSLNTIIFLVPADEFATAIRDGDLVRVDFRGAEEYGQHWDFGTLNKGQLKK